MVRSSIQRPTPGPKQSLAKMSSCCFEMEPPTYGKYFGSYLDRYKKGECPNRPQQKSNSASSSTSSKFCRGAHQANIRTTGAHDFHNMMWDPCVYRGNCSKSFDRAEINRCKRWKSDSDNLVKRRKYPRYQMKLGGIYLPKVEKTDQQEKSNLENMGIQTEKFLEELTEAAAKTDQSTQPDLSTNLRKDYGFMFTPISTGTNQGVQCDLGGTLFKHSIGPIKKQLSKKILEQSLLEASEEFELEELRKVKRAYMDAQREEHLRRQRFLEAQRSVAEDREKALANEKRLQLIAEEAEARVGAALFSSKILSGIMPIAFSMLQLDGYLYTSGVQDVYKKLLPTMNRDISHYYSLRSKVSRKLLDDMLQQVSNQREVEVASSMWNRDKETPPAKNPTQKRKTNTVPSRDTNTNNTRLSLDAYRGGSMPFDTDQFLSHGE